MTSKRGLPVTHPEPQFGWENGQLACRRVIGRCRPFVFDLPRFDLNPTVRKQNGVQDRTISFFDFVSKPIAVSASGFQGLQGIVFDMLVSEFDYAVVIRTQKTHPYFQFALFMAISRSSLRYRHGLNPRIVWASMILRSSVPIGKDAFAE